MPKTEIVVYIIPETPPIKNPSILIIPTVNEAKFRVSFGARKYVK
jgi:hypothetical protein